MRRCLRSSRGCGFSNRSFVVLLFIGDLAFFVGMEDYFEIWSPENARIGFADNPVVLEMLDMYLEERSAS